MSSTDLLITLQEIRLPDVDHADVQGFAREHTILHVDGFTVAEPRFCPLCVQIQFDLEAGLTQCPACGSTAVPGLAIANRDAYAVILAFSRYSPREAVAVRERHAALIDAATATYYRNPQPWQFDRRYQVWAYTPRGQSMIHQAYRDLQHVAVES
ncbi:hypothetical protein [Demequina sp.]|uniref:hypothetical protein n=1 Tax=Demequina sp. TaxID=2050685 RepID=UPI003D0A55DA